MPNEAQERPSIGRRTESSLTTAVTPASVYFDPTKTGSLGGVRRLKDDVGGKGVAFIKDWLRGQEAYMLHKPVRYKFKRRKTITAGPFQQFQADLLDTTAYSRKNGSAKYVLVVIDVFSKYVWARTLPNVKKAFQDILESVPGNRKPLYLQTDKGREFVSSAFRDFLQKEGISFFTSENDDVKCSVVERFNRTLQTKLHRYFTSTHTRWYVDVLPAVIDTYNNTRHNTTGASPRAVAVGSVSKEDVWYNIHRPVKSDFSPAVRPGRAPKTPAFAVGDFVRINKTRRLFKKGYLGGWSKEVFTVASLGRQRPRLKS